MTTRPALVLASFALALAAAAAAGQVPGAPQTVVIHDGSVALHALLWRPQGRRPFPAVVLNHGSGRTRADLERLGPYEANAAKLGPLFARHGYVFLYPFRRGVGLSTDQGSSAVELMSSAAAADGQQARDALQMRLLEGRELSDAESAVRYLRALPYVDPNDVAAVGHSFGGSLTLLLAERDPKLRAVVVFSAAGYSFDRSPELRARLLAAIDHIVAPVFFIHAENDYSLSSGRALDARRETNGRPHRLKVYPPVGETADDGHDFLHLGMTIWEPDAFAFLDEHTRR